MADLLWVELGASEAAVMTSALCIEPSVLPGTNLYFTPSLVHPGCFYAPVSLTLPFSLCSISSSVMTQSSRNHFTVYSGNIFAFN